MSAIRILAASSYAAHADESPSDIKSMLREEGGPRLRRSSRYTELALLGALRCIRELPRLPATCALYLTSSQGNVGDTVSLLHQIVRDGLEPMPFTFINVSSNMAGHAVAQALGLEGKNSALSRIGGAFDSALELARLDLQAGTVPMALVGVVEQCAWPLADQRQRLKIGEEVRLAEQSSWLLLSAAEGAGGLGEFAVHRRCRDIAELPSLKSAHWFAGPQLPSSVKADLGLPLTPLLEPGYSESITAHHLVEAIARGGEGPVGYLNGDGADGYVYFEFSRTT